MIQASLFPWSLGAATATGGRDRRTAESADGELWASVATRAELPVDVATPPATGRTDGPGHASTPESEGAAQGAAPSKGAVAERGMEPSKPVGVERVVASLKGAVAEQGAPSARGAVPSMGGAPAGSGLPVKGEGQLPEPKQSRERTNRPRRPPPNGVIRPVRRSRCRTATLRSRRSRKPAGKRRHGRQRRRSIPPRGGASKGGCPRHRRARGRPARRQTRSRSVGPPRPLHRHRRHLGPGALDLRDQCADSRQVR